MGRIKSDSGGKSLYVLFNPTYHLKHMIDHTFFSTSTFTFIILLGILSLCILFVGWKYTLPPINCL